MTTLLRLEVLRYRRTARWIPIAAVFTIFGFGGPLLAKFLPDLLRNQTSDNITIVVSAPRPVDGIAIFGSNATQLGLLVSVVVAAGVLAVDARPSLAAFYRTRVRPLDRVVMARYVAAALVVSTSYVIGALCAWYETTVLLGHVDQSRYLLGVALVVEYLWFAVAVVVLAAGVTRSVVGTAGTSIGILLALPIVGTVDAVAPWLPSTLLGAQVSLAGGGAPADFVRAAVTTAAAAVVALTVGLHRFRVRET